MGATNPGDSKTRLGLGSRNAIALVESRSNGQRWHLFHLPIARDRRGLGKSYTDDNLTTADQQADPDSLVAWQGWQLDDDCIIVDELARGGVSLQYSVRPRTIATLCGRAPGGSQHLRNTEKCHGRALLG